MVGPFCSCGEREEYGSGSWYRSWNPHTLPHSLGGWLQVWNQVSHPRPAELPLCQLSASEDGVSSCKQQLQQSLVSVCDLIKFHGWNMLAD